MSADNSDKTRGMFANPLPIVMVALLAGSVLVKNVPLESARPIEPERVRFMSTTQQDVEARLWQDPFAAVEKHVGRGQDTEFAHAHDASTSKVPPYEVHTPEALNKRIKELGRLTVVAVSVFGGSFVEAAESRRRSRFAVVSALGFHNYHPEIADAIGYFDIDLPEPDGHKLQLTVPFELYNRKEPHSNVLVLWLDEEKFTTTPLEKLQTVLKKLSAFNCRGWLSESCNHPLQLPSNVLALLLDEKKFTTTPFEKLQTVIKSFTLTLPANCCGLNVKLVGPAGSEMLANLVTYGGLENSSSFQVFSPSATVSNCELSLVSGGRDDSKKKLWECIKIKDFPRSNDLTMPQIVRTTGTDDKLAAALLWELWLRGVNSKFGYDDSWWEPQWAKRSPHYCKDGLVLISERDTKYARTLSRNLTDGFLSFCEADPNAPVRTETGPKVPVRTFTYLRGLDGVLPDIDKSGIKVLHKDDGGNSKDLRAQLKDVPLEHAEGRSQHDYLRRLADEIEQLNNDKGFADNGIKAIGIVGSDVYDKLLIIQALRSRFKDKIFFTTDLDARYLHANQKDWTRNLVVASNFGLSLRPELQRSTLPFRDSYQTATYLATLMALEDKEFDGWTDKMTKWLHPQIFEIGRTEAVHLASPTVKILTDWYDAYRNKGSNPKDSNSKDSNPKVVSYEPCDPNDWVMCKGIEPNRRPPLRPSFKQLPMILLMSVIGFLLIFMASSHVRDTLSSAKNTLFPPWDAKAAKFWVMSVVLLVLVISISALFIEKMDTSLTKGIGEPFVWLEGTSVWPSLVLGFIGLMSMFGFEIWFMRRIRRDAHSISNHFNFALPQTWTLARGRLAAVYTGPYFDLASFNMEGKTDPKSVGPGVEIATLWQRYLCATGMREMWPWITFSTVLGVVLYYITFYVFGKPLFPHRGELVERLNLILVFLNALILWLVIFWVSYQTRACAQFIKILSNTIIVWPEPFLKHKEGETGVPRAHLADYLNFQLVMRATQRIYRLIYLPFVSILFMAIAQSDLFDAMNFPLALVFVIGLVLVFTLSSEVLLYKGAVATRTKALDYYETLLLRKQAPPKKDNCNKNPEDSSPSPDMANLPDSTEPPISAEQIKLLMERIRNTRDGVFAPIYEQPALRALLLPFGGFGGAQLIEFLINLMV